MTRRQRNDGAGNASLFSENAANEPESGVRRTQPWPSRAEETASQPGAPDSRASKRRPSGRSATADWNDAVLESIARRRAFWSVPPASTPNTTPSAPPISSAPASAHSARPTPSSLLPTADHAAEARGEPAHEDSKPASRPVRLSRPSVRPVQVDTVHNLHAVWWPSAGELVLQARFRWLADALRYVRGNARLDEAWVNTRDGQWIAAGDVDPEQQDEH